MTPRIKAGLLLGALLALFAGARVSWGGGPASPRAGAGDPVPAKGREVEAPARTPQRPAAAAAGEARPAAAPPPRVPEPQVLAVLSALTGIAREAAFEDAALAARPECAAERTPECLRVLSDALYGALAAKVEPAILSNAIDVRSIVPLGAERIHAAVGDVLLRSSDPIERVVALALLDRLSDVQPLALPAALYREFGDKPVVESQLLLRHHVTAALPAAAVAEVQALAAGREVDSRVQSAALEALAHGESARELDTAVEQLATSREAGWEGWVESVAPALGRCGLACAETTERLVASAEPNADLAIAILRLAPPLERPVLFDQLQPMLAQADLSRARSELNL